MFFQEFPNVITKMGVNYRSRRNVKVLLFSGGLVILCFTFLSLLPLPLLSTPKSSSKVPLVYPSSHIFQTQPMNRTATWTALQALYPKADSSLQVCVLVRTYAKQYSNLPALILNFAEDQVRTKVFITITDEDSPWEPVLKMTALINEMVGREVAIVLPIKRGQAEKVWVQPNNGLDYGYTYTDAAIDMMVANGVPCDFILVTNGDNVYASNFLHQHLLSHMESDFDMIGFSYVEYGVHASLFETVFSRIFDRGQNIDDDGTFKTFPFYWETGNCDLGAVLIKWHWFRTAGLRFVKYSRLNDDTSKDLYSADGQMIELISRKGAKKVIVRKVLFIHQ